MHDVMQTINTWLAQGKQAALATVIETWGSAPRQAGAKMGVTASSEMIGSVSGGCVEGAVISEALDSLEDTRPRLLDFGVSDETAWDVGLACGGRITVFVEPLDAAWWQVMHQALAQERPMATAAIIEGEQAGKKVLVWADGETGYASPGLSEAAAEMLRKAAQAGLETGNSGRQAVDNHHVFVDVHQPRPRLIIIGGAHVAMDLQVFANRLGFQVFLIDPRQAFATTERFPGVQAIYHTYPDKALPQIGIDAQTYIAVLTHDPKIDDPALITALPSPAAYIGVLSSAKTHEGRVERLLEAGLSLEQIGRIRTPIGIDINARTPAEIALCIMAEIVAVRNGAVEKALA